MKHQYKALSALLALSVAPVFALGVQAEEVKSTTTVNATTQVVAPKPRALEERRLAELKALEMKKLEMRKAQGTSTGTSTDARKEKREEVKGEMKEVRQDFRAQEVKMRVRNVTRVFTATVERLEKIVTRIESRITKIKAAGGTTTEAEAFVDAAKVNLATVKTDISAINSIDLSGSTTTAQANFETIKADAQAGRESLTSARQNLEKALASLMKLEKTVKVKENKNATSTATSTEVR